MREEHTFQFTAGKISASADREAQYHRKRVAFWDEEYGKAVERVRKTASVEVVESPVTGGMRADVRINYGDPVAYQRLGESYEKIHRHRADAERLETESALYGSQDPSRVYELSASDVHYFRLDGSGREK